MSIAVGYNKIDQIYYNGQGVDKIYKGEDLVYDRSLQNKFEYFYVYADQPISSESAQHVGTVSLENNGGNTPNLEYSRDGINWTTWDYSSLDLVGPVTSDESGPIYSFIFFRGYNPNGFSQSGSVWSRFRIIDSLNGNAYIHIGGNIMSLLYKDSFWKEDESPNNTIPNDYCFTKIFYGSNIYSCLGMPGRWTDDQQKLHPLNPLRLPAKNLTNSCYKSMFFDCSMLEYGPLILPADNLIDYCYSQMLYNCTLLEKAPLLPAMELKQGCYQYMFTSCINLKYIKTAATDISATGCMTRWVDGVSSTGTFVKKRGVTYPAGGNGIPITWTVEEID